MRIKLYGGNEKARQHYEEVLKENPELETRMILVASNEEATLRELIEERAAIRYAEGLPGDKYSAVESNIRSEGE